MKNYGEDLVSETCTAKLRAGMIEAIEDAFDPLNCHEAEVLKLRMGLEANFIYLQLSLERKAKKEKH